MEEFTVSLTQFIDSEQLQRSVPEYLWFLIAIGGIIGALSILWKLANYLISNLDELKNESAQHSEEISVINETLKNIKEILVNYGSDIRELRNRKRS